MSGIRTIEVELLRQWLEQQRQIIVLDVRPSNERAEWAIPGSIHIDAYDALQKHDPHALDQVTLPRDIPIVTVCAAGRTSLLAAQLLQDRGLNVYSLAGGMGAWSLAWNLAEVHLKQSAARVIQIRRTGKGCLSYLIGAETAAVVIDPCLPLEVYQAIAAHYQWRISQVLETHLHADHLSRAKVLAEHCNATLLFPLGHGIATEYTPLHDGETLSLGAFRLTVLHTPGHTPESVCYLLDDSVLFTGDTLFLKAVGRPDLRAHDKQAAHDNAHALYQSLQRIATLDPALIILPGHTDTPISFDNTPLASSLAQVRVQLPLLQSSEAVFTETILARIPATPPHHDQIIAMNRSGHFEETTATSLEAGANRCAVAG